ncbi:MAG: hypothetical protein WC220_13480 [Pedobacter sp.]|jgi:hypothetical protein
MPSRLEKRIDKLVEELELEPLNEYATQSRDYDSFNRLSVPELKYLIILDKCRHGIYELVEMGILITNQIRKNCLSLLLRIVILKDDEKLLHQNDEDAAIQTIIEENSQLSNDLSRIKQFLQELLAEDYTMQSPVQEETREQINFLLKDPVLEMSSRLQNCIIKYIK